MADDSKQNVNQMSEELLGKSTNDAISRVRIIIEAETPSDQEMSFGLDVSNHRKESWWREWLTYMWRVLAGIFISSS